MSAKRQNRRQFLRAGLGAGAAALFPYGFARAAAESGAPNEFHGKVVLITGATSGLGKYYLLEFAKLGAKVAFCGRRANLGTALEAQVKASGGEAAYFKADVQNQREVKAFVDFTVRKFGRVDIAVNNAGIEFQSKNFATDDLAKHIDVIQTNLMGTMFCLKYELAQMEKQGGGAIVNMGSVASVRGSPEEASYSASKHGVVGLSRSLAKRYAPKNIRINVLSPYLVDHQMGGPDGPMPAEERASYNLAEKIPAGRLISMDDVFQSLLWLCSARSSMVMGSNLVLDGAGLS